MVFFIDQIAQIAVFFYIPLLTHAERTEIDPVESDSSVINEKRLSILVVIGRKEKRKHSFQVSVSFISFLIFNKKSSVSLFSPMINSIHAQTHVCFFVFFHQRENERLGRWRISFQSFVLQH